MRRKGQSILARRLIAHLLFVARRVEVLDHNAAECGQRAPALLVRQPSPELIERRWPKGRRAWGGAMTASPRDMSHLLGSPGVELGPIPPAGGGRPARSWGCPPIPVQARGWGQSDSCFLYHRAYPSLSQ